MPPSSLAKRYTLREIADDEVSAFVGVVEHAFGGSGLTEREVEDRRAVLEPSRSLGVVAEDELVATLGVYTLSMSIPGAFSDVAGVNHVAVRGDHRRQGLMTALMTTALRSMRDRGDALSALWPSEAGIYGRFGYGLASQHAIVSIDGRAAVSAGASGQKRDAGYVRLYPGSDNVDLTVLDDLYGSWQAKRPGSIVRSPVRWAQRLARKPTREGGTSISSVVHFGADGPDGYALYSSAPDWGPGRVPYGRTTVYEVCTGAGSAVSSLWAYLLSVDMMSTTSSPIMPLDEPGYWCLADPRHWSSTVTDNLWVRLIDVPRALAQRTYSRHLDVVLEVTDDFFPENEGRFHLQAGEGGATCDRTTAPPDLQLSVALLGAAYLGGTPLAALAASGVGELRTGALDATSAGFRSPLAPCCIDPF